MTAMAVALVLCCAMVCGTVLAYQWRCTVRSAADANALAQEAMDEAVATRGTLKFELKRVEAVVDEIASLRNAVDALRAQAAFRGM